MSMSALCTIINETGEPIIFTTITSTNEGYQWLVNPLSGTTITNGESCTIKAGNGIPFPSSVGFQAHFVALKSGRGVIYLEGSAVGDYQFHFDGNFKYLVHNSGGNNYTVIVRTV